MYIKNNNNEKILFKWHSKAGALSEVTSLRDLSDLTERCV